MNTTSPYQNIFSNTKCLSFDELTAYNKGCASKSEKHRIEEHLLGCELCSSALAGFAAVPVSAQDIDDLHSRIDAMSKTKRWYTSKYFIAGVAMLLFTGIFLLISNPFKKESRNYVPAPVVKNNSGTSEADQFEKAPLPAIDEPTLKKVESIRIASKENFVKPQAAKGPQAPPATNNAPANDPAPKVNKTEPKPAPAAEEDVEAEIKYNAPVRYIQELKITDFEKLYVKPIDLRRTHNNLPAWLENEKKKDDFDPAIETERSIPADEVLAKGLRNFKRGKWAEAMAQFDMLLEHNGKDINSLFYKGICAWNLNRALIAQDCLLKVLANSNNVFHQEAKWYLALTYIKAGETDTASELLTEIVNEKGFYRKQAREALKELE